jgi:hypothetical protein
MPKATPKYELLIDLSNPVNELIESIILVANSQPGKQLEILQQVELKLGEQIQAIENQLKAAAPTTPTEQTESKEKK